MGQTAVIPATPEILANMTPVQTAELIEDISADRYQQGYSDGKRKGLLWGIGGTLVVLLVVGRLRKR
jgi:hypothetical protein